MCASKPQATTCANRYVAASLLELQLANTITRTRSPHPVQPRRPEPPAPRTTVPPFGRWPLQPLLPVGVGSVCDARKKDDNCLSSRTKAMKRKD